ncbi:MAG: N utilization substance protein A [Candidatus Marinamargulisbacteria bacterium]|jgi:N utilization substance protein A
MIVIDNLKQVAAQIETERGVSPEILISAIEQALISACRRKLSEEVELVANLNEDTGEVKIFQVKTVVKSVENEDLEIALKDAKKIQSDAKLEDTVQIEFAPPDFGRIAAQTARQVIIQRIREAEKDSIYSEYKDRESQIINGVVQRIEARSYLINLGRAEALLNIREQIPEEVFTLKEKVKVFLERVEKGNRGNVLHISRTHPDLLRRLLEQEIPEIQDGIIEIMAIARDPGKRSKVAVKTNNPAIGAVGTCVGQMGGRIQSVIKELRNEKIDVLEWEENPQDFISNALKPAKISKVIIRDEANREAIVVVPNDQLSLAIGKQGVNVRLSVRLTKWKLDILSEEEYGKQEDKIKAETHVSIVDRIKMDKEKDESEDSSDQAEAAQAPQEESLLSKMGKSLAAEEIKVSELAKEVGMKTKELIEAAKGFGVEIKNIRSKVVSEDAQTIREKLG